MKAVWLVLLFFSPGVLGQKILVLSPERVSCEPSLMKEAVPLMKQTGPMFKEQLNDMLDWHFKNLLILQKSMSVTGLPALKKLAESTGAAYIVNLSNLSFYREGMQLNMTLSVELYSKFTSSVIFQKEYKGHDFSHGLEVNCNEPTLACIMNNCLVLASSDMCNPLLLNHPATREIQQKLNKDDSIYFKRGEVLRFDHFKRPWDGTLAISVIGAKDPVLKPEEIFYSLQNDDKTKFVALFMHRLSLTGEPAALGYIVRGMLYNGQWHYNIAEDFKYPQDEVSHMKEFMLMTLRNWDFFTPGTADYNPYFWTGRMFVEPVK